MRPGEVAAYEVQHPGRVGTPAGPRADEEIVAEIPITPSRVLRVSVLRNHDGTLSFGLRLHARDPRQQLWPMKGYGFLARMTIAPELIEALKAALEIDAADAKRRTT